MTKLPEMVTVFPYGVVDLHGNRLTKEAAQHMVEDIRENGFKVDGESVYVHSVYLTESVGDPNAGRVMVEWSK